MRGLELPINVIVIIVIIALVALAVISFFILAFGPSSTGLGLEAKKSAGCLQWNCNRDISPSNIKVGDTNLGAICTGRGESTNICNLTCSCNWK